VKKRLVLLGAPGSGKGTQAELITRHFGIPVTSPGAILRREKDLGTALGTETSEIIQQGGLVPDATIVKLIEDWLRLHGAHGFVFDGFPRTVPQAESLRRFLTDIIPRSISQSGSKFPKKPCAIVFPGDCNAAVAVLSPVWRQGISPSARFVLIVKDRWSVAMTTT
jgi:hypothetical protein